MKNVAEVQGLALPAAKQRLRRGRMMLVTALASGAERRAALQGVPLGCWDARRRVSDYLNGDLDREEAALVERHLESCPTCPPLYASLVGVHAQLGWTVGPGSSLSSDPSWWGSPRCSTGLA
jgi:RNA polymerase sigma-70 factor (ECF subfamily)